MPGTATRGAPVELTDGAGIETGTLANPLDVNIASGGSIGTEYTEGDTDATITGTAVLWEDTADTLRAVSAAKPLPVNIVAGAGSGGAAQADKSAFTEGTTSFTPVGGVYNETITADPTEDQAAAARITAKRAVHTNLRNVAGTEVGTAGAPLRTDPTGSTTQPVSGTVTANAGTGPFEVQATAGAPASARLSDGAAFYDATKTGQLPAALSGGRLDVIVGAALPAGTANIGDVDVLTLPALPAGTNNIGDVDVLTLPNVTLAAGTNTNEVVGDAAHDDAAAGNPLLVGGYASAAAPADVSADADAVRAWRLRNGAAATVLTAAGALIGGDATNGLDVDVTRLPALPAGTNNIGDVDVLSLPALPAGTNNIGDVDVLSLPVGTVAGGSSLPAGTNNIGDVDVLSLPALVAGTANIGDVDVLTMPNVTLAAGTNTNEVVGDAAHDAAAAGNPLLVGGYASAAAPADVSADADAVRAWYLRNGAAATVLTAAGALIGGDAANGLDVDVTRLPALAAGTNNIGDVDVLTLPALPAGTNNIGDVDVLTMPNVTLAAGTNTNEVVGDAAHDAAAAGNPLLMGGYASAAAPADVSADADAVRAWRLRNGAAATVLTAAGALIGGDATNGLDVDVTRLPALVAGTANIGDVDIASGPTGSSAIQVQGTAAVDAPVVGNPVRIGACASSADPTAVAAADAIDVLLSLVGKQVMLPFALPGNTWSYAAAAGGLVNTTGVTAKAAAGAGIRNYVTRISVVNSHQTISSEVVIRDGAAGTVLWRGWAQAAGGGQVETFNPPLRGTANTLLEIAEVTATATAGLLVNVGGFVAAE